jgi:hypothetical protein
MVTLLVGIKYVDLKGMARVVCNGMPSCQAAVTVLTPAHVGLREKLSLRFPTFWQ